MNKVAGDKEIQKILDEISGVKAAGQKVDSARLHPFPARMPLSLTEYIINGMTSSDAIILDPMIGSGTTMIATKKLGRSGIGFDIDPLAILMARVSTHTYNINYLNDIKEYVLFRAGKIIKKTCLPDLKKRLHVKDKNFVEYWFPSHSQKQLFALSVAINELQKGFIRDLAWVVFSSIIIAKTAGASYAMDISRSRPHKRLDKPVIAPFNIWKEKFDLIIRHLPFTKGDGFGKKIHINRGDARSLSLADDSTDFILTSPPYQNAIDYIRSHKFSLVWMGYDLGCLREIRGGMIGAERGLNSPDGLPSEVENRLSQTIVEQSKQAIIRRYLSDLGKSIKEISRVLRRDGVAILILGPTMINSKKSDAAAVASAIGQKYGLTTVGYAIRCLNTARRSLPPPSIIDEQNHMSQRMRREVLIALRKKD